MKISALVSLSILKYCLSIHFPSQFSHTKSARCSPQPSLSSLPSNHPWQGSLPVEKLGPDNQVNDIYVNFIWPVIVQYFGVIFPSYQYCNATTGLTPAEKKNQENSNIANGSSTRIPKGSRIFRLHLRPLQPLLDNKTHHCTILLFQFINILSIPSQI